MRLSRQAPALPGATWPTYRPEERGAGILHLGLGAFARAHICAYTDAALAAADGDWRIRGASLRGTDVAQALNPQDGRYTLLTRAGRTEAQVIGSLSEVIAGSDAAPRIIAAIADPACRIISLTVTEKGYGLLREGGADTAHPAVAHDLAAPHTPVGVLGLIALGLMQRFAAGHGALTVLSCDNLPENGRLLAEAVLDFAARAHGPDLAARIRGEIAFPSTMVDRITPRSTDDTFADASALTGTEDLAAVETEPFSQWVIEDHFAAGRPVWEAGGATFTANVIPFEAMKLRMLNGSHSMMAYAGALSGHAYVRDVMADPELAALVRRHLAAAAATLDPFGVDLEAYAQALLSRFANPAIAHATTQIAMDGSQKMPPRIFAPACEAARRGQNLSPFAFATAAWMMYLRGRNDAGEIWALNDPVEDQLGRAAAAGSAADVFDALAALPGLMPPDLAAGAFRSLTVARLEGMRNDGIRAAIARELA